MTNRLKFSRIRPALVALATACVAVSLAACGVDSDYVPADKAGSTTAPDASGNTAGGAKGGPTADKPKPDYSAKFTQCAEGSFGMIDAELTITNHTDQPRSYLVTGEAVDADGNRLAELTASANSVRPGQTATTEALGTVDGNVPDFKCKVVEVTSF